MPYSLGSWQIDVVSGGLHRTDGGGMFGVVPKPLWAKLMPPDEQNRILMATNCLLCRDGKHTVLIDAGAGNKCSDREKKNYALEPGEPLARSLEAIGVSPSQIDTFIFSHLHFDHAGGATRLNERGQVELTFPNARYVAGRVEWGVATNGLAEFRAAYPQENIAPLAALPGGKPELIEDGAEIVPGIRAMVTHGHTEGHFAITLESQGQTAIYLGDLCPTVAHLRQLWCMAYDVYPRETRRRKPQILGRCADEGWLVFWDHDPVVFAGRLRRDEKTEFAVTPE